MAGSGGGLGAFGGSGSNSTVGVVSPMGSAGSAGGGLAFAGTPTQAAPPPTPLIPLMVMSVSDLQEQAGVQNVNVNEPTL